MAKVQQTSVELQHGNKTFSFRLDVEELDFGPAGRLRYYSMGAATCRNKGNNGRAAVDLFVSSVLDGGDEILPDKAEAWLMAEAFLRLAPSKAILDVYGSTYLSHRADREVHIDVNEIERLKTVTRGPIEGVQREFERLFVRSPLPGDVSIRGKFNQGYIVWIARGMIELRKGRVRGLNWWLKQVDDRFRSIRRRGNAKLTTGDDGKDVRLFANFFTFEAYLALVHCVSYALVKMPKILQKQGRMTPIEARLHHLMHGIHGLVIDPQAGGSHRGILNRQPLSLHPVGRYLLNKGEYRAVIGKWIAAGGYDKLIKTPRMLDDKRFRDFLGVLLRGIRT